MVNSELTLFIHVWAMRLDNIPLLSVLRGRLGYLSQRQELIAENVANTDTPGYRPKDLKPFTIPGQGGAGAHAPGQVQIIATDPSHIAPVQRTTSGYSPVDAPDSETTLDGNQVVLEDQMIKMNQARMDYDAAISFYQKSLSLIRMAARRPGV